MFEFQWDIRQIQMWPLQLKRLLIYPLAKASDEWTARRTDGQTKKLLSARQRINIRSEVICFDLT